MMKHVIRIASPQIRRPLLLLVYPFSFAHLLLLALWHRPSRLFAFDFYELSWAIFWAAWDGAFVP